MFHLRVLIFYIYLHSSSRVFRTGMLQFSPPYKNFIPKFQYSNCVGIQLTFPLCRAFISCRLIGGGISSGIYLTLSFGYRFQTPQQIVGQPFLSLQCFFRPCLYMQILHANYHLKYYNDSTMQNFYARVISLGSDTKMTGPEPGYH